MTSQAAWLLLATVPGVGPMTFWRLVGRFGSAEAVLAASELDLAGVGKCSPDVAAAITRAGVREGDLLARFEALRGRGIEAALAPSPQHSGGAAAEERGAYPGWLAARRAPPPVVLIWGSITEGDSRAVAVVGSRRASEAGLEAARAIVLRLANAGATVVSGLALGVDTAAHEATLDSGGRTIAVLGSGIERVYPPANAALAERIARNGAVVSEFAPTVPVSREGLLARNRTIAGLSRALVVVQTRHPGGAVVAAQHAREFGVPVIAVEDSTGDRDFAAGVEALRALGATVVGRERAAEEALSALDREPAPAQPSLL